MDVARRLGPLLMMILGAALLLNPAPSSAVDVGSTVPCILVPCSTTSLTLDTTTTTAVTTTETEMTEPSTTETTMATTSGPATTAPATTAPPVVGSGGAVRPRVLARTGSNPAPMTVAGIALLATGAALALAGRRRSLAGR